MELPGSHTDSQSVNTDTSSMTDTQPTKDSITKLNLKESFWKDFQSHFHYLLRSAGYLANCFLIHIPSLETLLQCYTPEDPISLELTHWLYQGIISSSTSLDYDSIVNYSLKKSDLPVGLGEKELSMTSSNSHTLIGQVFLAKSLICLANVMSLLSFTTDLETKSNIGIATKKELLDSANAMKKLVTTSTYKRCFADVLKNAPLMSQVILFQDPVTRKRKKIESESESSESDSSSSDASTHTRTSTCSTTATGTGKHVDAIATLLGKESSRLMQKERKQTKLDTSYPTSSIQIKVGDSISSHKLDPPPRRGQPAVGTQQERGDWVIQTRMYHVKDFMNSDSRERYKMSFCSFVAVVNQNDEIYKANQATVKAVQKLMRSKGVTEKVSRLLILIK